jgi:enamine deaminase RidA (YjgF/YER057c/UK114 family)
MIGRQGEEISMSAEKRLKELGLVLPPPPSPKGNYVPGIVHNGILYLSGQGPLIEADRFAQGMVGRDVTLEEAYGHARLTGLVLLSIARNVLGSLDKVERVLNVYGMVRAAPDFADHPRVINGCSDLMVEVFGDKGRHTRAAVGMGSLPMGISVEITATMATVD